MRLTRFGLRIPFRIQDVSKWMDEDAAAGKVMSGEILLPADDEDGDDDDDEW